MGPRDGAAEMVCAWPIRVKAERALDAPPPADNMSPQALAAY